MIDPITVTTLVGIALLLLKEAVQLLSRVHKSECMVKVEN